MMKKFILYFLMFPFVLKAQTKTLAGVVVSENDKLPVAGAVLKLKNSATYTQTDQLGRFSMVIKVLPAILEISSVGYDSVSIDLASEESIVIYLKEAMHLLDEVFVSTGYQRLSNEKSTGSFSQINNELINRSVSTDIISRLDGVTSGLNFDRRYSGGAYGDNSSPRLKLRGLSTIEGNESPLIVVDNFPYDGSIENLNPNDIESVTVLKDAGAASIWGAQAGNGVIVITTKRGRAGQPLQISYRSNLTTEQKPDLFYSPNYLNSSDFLAVELQLFRNNHYFESEFEVLSPFVEALYKLQKEDGVLSEGKVQALISEFSAYDVRASAREHLYRNSFTQQHSLSFRGGQDKLQYFLSGGYDKSLHNLQGNESNRTSVTANLTFNPVKRLYIDSQLSYLQNGSVDNGLPLNVIKSVSHKSLYPYAIFADEEGSPLSIPKNYRYTYIEDQMTKGSLDWTYKPLEEIRNNDRKVFAGDYRMALGIRYTVLKGLDLETKYQYFTSMTTTRDLNSENTFYTRNLINEYTQRDGSYAIPLGAILDQNHAVGVSHSGRLQLNYVYDRSTGHYFSFLTGAEMRNVTSSSAGSRLYGYNDDILTNRPVDYLTQFDLMPGGRGRIPGPAWGLSDLTDRYISYYGNALYRLSNKYALSGSFRKDASNLFGVRTNQKWVPLWSIGLAWEVEKEDFYEISWLPRLKVRSTFGYNGNINKSMTAFTTVSYHTDQLTGKNYGSVNTAPNQDLRWEKVGIFNLGLDFGFKGNRIKGSLEYFLKNGSDLIGDVPIDPTTGFHRSRRYSYKLNYADLQTQGLDITVNTRNTVGKVSWSSDFLVSYVSDKVTNYRHKNTDVVSYLSGLNASPSEGKPLYAIYSYPWKGLDVLGDPIVEVEGKVSKDYASYVRTFTPDQLIYHGSALPRFFGSLRNSLDWRQFSLSFNLVFKAGYYFKRSSVNYTNLINFWEGHRDFENRWQQPGDELVTDVPAFSLIPNANRDLVYNRSSALIEKGDHVRFQDCRIGYSLFSKTSKSMEFFLYARNLGIVWRANKMGLDPDFPIVQALPSKSLSLGLNFNF
jgi:TonB-linked SusC/RagA family outer membrane protein